LRALDQAISPVTLEARGFKPKSVHARFMKGEKTLAEGFLRVLRFPLSVLFNRGPGSSVSIATDYGLDGPEIESRWGRDFSHMPRPALGPTQPSVQWAPSLSRG
jgi:hypothetical protein